MQAESDDKAVRAFFAKEDGKIMAKGVGTFPFKPLKVRKFYEKMENKPLFDEQFISGKIFD